MGADFSRIRIDPLLDFAGIELKQGGVVLDADFNELVGVLDRRLRAAASDILGRSAVSTTTPDAFRITIVAGALQIGRGRLYVDGLLAENHGATSDAPDQLFDTLLAEPTFADPVPYAAQPYLPMPPALPTAGRHLVYLDVWNRELTHLERPQLVEVAVGVESSSRVQTVWQVRVLAPDARTASCDSEDGDIAGWPELIAPSTGRLTTGTVDVPPADDPCELPPSGGYRGLENQTYRVEIHDPGQAGSGATFKWSRDNASVGSRVSNVVSATELELQSLGRDDVLRFNSGDWVEIIDDVRELSQRCGEMRRITVNEAARRITFAPALPAEMLPAAFPDAEYPATRNLRVRRWDHKHRVQSVAADGTATLFQDLDAGTSGVINVPPAGTTLLLENGVTVSFPAPRTGLPRFRAGDYWVFAARTADASVELLVNAPPRGIHHHYARLGFWDVAAGEVSDCRHPPGAEGHDCSCTQCVTPESHASGALTIQAAVDRIRDSGGTVCLSIGRYALREPVRLNGVRSMRIRGLGASTMIVTPGGAFSLATAIAVSIEDLMIVSLGTASAISVRTALGLTLQRLVIAVLGSNDARGAAIALSGVVAGALLRDNALIAPVGVAIDAARGPNERAPARSPNEGAPARFLATALLSIENNLMWCERQALRLDGTVLHLMATRVCGNEIAGCRQGAVTALGLAAPGASMKICDNSLNVSGAGITAGVDGLWIEGNKLFAAASSANDRVLNGTGIALRTGLDPNGIDQCHVLGNQISGFEEAGIVIASPAADLIVKMNLVSRCGNGIVSTDDARSGTVSIENNHVSDIGRRDGAAREVLGVGVLRADTATVANNAIRRIGLTAEGAAVRAGIAATGVERLRVAGNDVVDIAPPGNFENGIGAGLLVRAPYGQALISGNQIDRESQPRSQVGGRFTALMIDAAGDERNLARAGAYAALLVNATTTLVLGARRPFLRSASALDASGAAADVDAEVSVLGNTLGSSGRLQAVRIATAGDCSFSDNRCELRSRGAAAVQLTAAATIVNANRVRGGEIGIDIRGNAKRATVLGNITQRGIVMGGPLSAPWESLNVQG